MARVQYTAEDKREIGRLLQIAKTEQRLSREDIADRTALGKSTVGRALVGAPDTKDSIYIAVMRELGVEYTQPEIAPLFKEANNKETLKSIKKALDYGLAEMEDAEADLLCAGRKMQEARALIDEAYEKLEEVVDDGYDIRD